MKKIFFAILILFFSYFNINGQNCGQIVTIDPYEYNFGPGMPGATKTIQVTVLPFDGCETIQELDTGYDPSLNIASEDIVNNKLCKTTIDLSDYTIIDVTVTYPQENDDDVDYFARRLDFHCTDDPFIINAMLNIQGIVDPFSPTAPSNLRLVSQTQTTCNLAWNASTDNIGVQGYKIYKNDVLLVTVPNTTLTYSASITNNVSSFKVLSYDEAGNVSLYSNTINVSGAPPATPVATAATNVSANSFVVNWTPSSGATGYVLDISTSSNFSSFVYNNLSTATLTGNPNGSVIVYSGINPGTTYYYRIRATKSTIQSPNSNVITVLTLPAAPLAITATNVLPTSFTANWSSVPGIVSGYRLDVSTNSAFTSFVSGYQNLSVSGTSRSVTGLTSSNTYYYRVRAINSGGSSINSNIIATAYILPPVANAATNVTSNSFTVNWTPSSGATGYVLDISTSSNFSSFVYIYNNLSTASLTGNPNGSVIVYSGINPGTTYYYRIRAVKNTAQSANSNVISVRTTGGKSAPIEESPGISGSKLIIYPNPVNEILNVELKNFDEKVNIDIFNSTGILIKSLILNDSSNYIDVSSFPKGMYLIIANDNVTSKFIKE